MKTGSCRCSTTAASKVHHIRNWNEGAVFVRLRGTQITARTARTTCERSAQKSSWTYSPAKRKHHASTQSAATPASLALSSTALRVCSSIVVPSSGVARACR